jgi:DNA-binding transcriptional LysR family regulator
MVRAGRGLVPTPRAIELRERTAQLVHDAEAVLSPQVEAHLDQLVRTFTLRTSDGFVENFGPVLVARVGKEAPGVRLRFLQKTDKDAAPLRDGTVDLETGVIAKGTAPEFRQQSLFRDRYVGVVRRAHPLGKGRMTIARFAGGRHVGVARRGVETAPVDEPLGEHGAHRQIVTLVGGFAAALALARGTDLIACVPEKHTGNLRAGMHTFRLPFATPEISIAMLWHPRMEADAGHAWLRGVVREVCRGE